MDNMNHPASATEVTTTPSLAEIRTRILADQTLTEGRRRDMASALSSMAKALGRPAEAISADPKSLRAALKGVTAAMVGLEQGTWRNVQSLTGVALFHAGIVVVQTRIREAPSPEWAAVLALLDVDVHRHFELWRFARRCTQLGVGPDAVCDTVVARFLDDLIHRSLVSEPERSARDTARYWNEAADTYPAWPKRRLSVADNRNAYAPGWEVYPESLVREANAWCEGLGESNPFAARPFKALKPASVESRRKQLKLYLGALVLQGADPAELVDLTTVVKPARAKIALTFFWERAGKKATTHTSLIANMALMIARHWAELPEADVKWLAAITKQLRPERTGMTAKNTAALRPLDDPDKLRALLDLPPNMMAEAGRLGAPSVQAARVAQTAALIEVLLHLPLRLANLRDLRIGTHLIRGPKGALHICVAGDEVKNESPVSAAIAGDAAKLLNAYIDRYRPLLAAGNTDYLWPGTRAGTPKCDDTLRGQIQDALADRIGVRLNPHCFRHLAAYIMLKDDPGCHGKVQRVLGHRSHHSTMAFYSGMETPAAIEAYDGLIAAHRREPRASRQKPVGGRGGR